MPILFCYNFTACNQIQNVIETSLQYHDLWHHINAISSKFCIAGVSLCRSIEA